MCTSFFANLFFQKHCFAEYLVIRLIFTFSSIVFVNFLLVLREKSFCVNHEAKKYSLGSGEYSFECTLAFVTIHPWANTKWPINWLIRVLTLLLLCYSAFCLEITLSLTDLFIYLFINMLKSFYLISVITQQTTTCRLLILLPGRTLGSHFTLLLTMFPCTMRDLNRYMLCTAI